MNVVCLFEQSGIFKSEFIKQGHKCVDIDIENSFHQTDFVRDIFADIENDCLYYLKYNKVNLVFAFFPCTWFSNNNQPIWAGTWRNFKSWSEHEKRKYIENRYRQYFRARKLIRELVYYCKSNNIALIIENPLSKSIKEILGVPTYIDNNRSLHGDVYVKPTAYYCYGCSISELDIIPKEPRKIVSINKGISRSLMTKEYANNVVKHIIMR